MTAQLYTKRQSIYDLQLLVGKEVLYFPPPYLNEVPAFAGLKDLRSDAKPRVYIDTSLHTLQLFLLFFDVTADKHALLQLSESQVVDLYALGFALRSSSLLDYLDKLMLTRHYKFTIEDVNHIYATRASFPRELPIAL